MGEQLPIVGAGAALTVLLSVIVMFARTNASDRRSYWQRTADLLSQWREADETWQARLIAAEAANVRCEEMVDAERKLRRQVEDATYRRLEENAQELMKLRAEVAHLRRAVTGKLDELH